MRKNIIKQKLVLQYKNKNRVKKYFNEKFFEKKRIINNIL